METIKVIIGLVTGFLLVPSICWLAFVYPFGQVSLKSFFVSFVFGSFIGLVAVLGVAYWFASIWSKD